jgi:hypothetical protein
MILLYVLVILNLIWLFLITRAIYKKNKSRPATDSVTKNSSNFKLNITRFNPFDDMGGNQSFILTLLNQANSGVVLTSLHNRDITRLYAKPIKNGEGDNVTLSKDEKLAIVKTIKD